MNSWSGILPEWMPGSGGRCNFGIGAHGALDEQLKRSLRSALHLCDTPLSERGEKALNGFWVRLADWADTDVGILHALKVKNR